MHSLPFFSELLCVTLVRWGNIFLVIVGTLWVISNSFTVYHLLFKSLLLERADTVSLNWGIHRLFRATQNILASLAWLDWSLSFLSTHANSLHFILSDQYWWWYFEIILILTFKLNFFINRCWLTWSKVVRPVWLLLWRFRLFLLNIWSINVFNLKL